MDRRADNKERQLKWLYGLQLNGVRLGLRNTEVLLKRMGNPQDRFRTIHVAGSDGKGSTSAILASALQKAGYKVGLFTSPHIISFNERISIDGEPISDEDLAVYAAKARHFVDDMKESEIYCTFFEVTSAIAFDYFACENVDIAVIEVGMGGRFDATNIIVPDVSVITNISLEHKEYLGDTIEKIAYQKAGIIKKGVPSVTLNTGDALRTISQVASDMDSDLTAIDPVSVTVLRNLPDGPEFMYRDKKHKVSIPGRNEAKDAALAIEALMKLPEYGERIAPYLDEGLSEVRWPCRLEDVGNGFLLDVTHTAAGSEGLASDVAEIYGKVIVVFGLLEDKDISHIARNLSSVASAMVVTAPSCPRARSAQSTLETAKEFFPDAKLVEGVGNAIEYADKLRKEGEKVLITGSFYMAEEALKWMGRTSA